MESLVKWLSDSALHDYILAHSYVWPMLESLHFIGLCLLFGSLLLVDLRALGVVADVPYIAMEKFILVAVIGFFINLTTGITFIFGDPTRYFMNPSFQLKMLCLVLALANALYFSWRMKGWKGVVGADIAESAIERRLPIDMKWAAGLSLLLWVMVMIFGRLIPYVE